MPYGTPKARANSGHSSYLGQESSASENAKLVATSRSSAPTQWLSLVRGLHDRPVFMGLVQALEGRATSKEISFGLTAAVELPWLHITQQGRACTGMSEPP